LFSKIKNIIAQEFAIELRQKNTIFGIILYLASIVILIYTLQPEPEALQWNTLLWICCLFTVINTAAKNFSTETKGRWQYYYTVNNPTHIIIGKLIYNVLLMCGIATITLGLFILTMKFPASDKKVFIGLYYLGNISFTILFTFLSSLVSKVNNSGATLAVIGFPLVFPIIIVVSDLSISAFQVMLLHDWIKYLLALVVLDILILILSVILFPFIWKD
jgi:heme exporter protein B